MVLPSFRNCRILHGRHFCALQAACNVEGLNAAAPYYGDVPDEGTPWRGARSRWSSFPELEISGSHRIKVAGLGNCGIANNGLNLTSLKYDSDHAFTNKCIETGSI